jgi:uncharacterized protein (DUF433 family)
LLVTSLAFASDLEDPSCGKLGLEVAMMQFDRISVNPGICHGQACVRGTRIPVHQVIRMMANGDTVEDLLSDYPSLTRDDIMACLDYAAELAEEHVTPLSVVG